MLVLPASDTTNVAPREPCSLPALQSVAGADAECDIRVCPVCAGQKFQRPFPQAWPWLNRCSGCGLMFAAPQPSDRELASIYSASYFKTFGYSPSSTAAYRRMKRIACRKLLDDVRRLCPDIPGRRLLDVGSGLGDLLCAARDDGWTVCGLEQNEWAIAESERIVPGATRCGMLADADWPAESFDLITCLDVLEHLRDPPESLRQIFHWLRPGGALVITTVDADSWSARLSGWRWVHIHRDHLWYFNRQTLVRLLSAAGFQPTFWEVPRKVFNLRYLLTIVSHHARPRFGGQLCGWLLKVLPEKCLSVPLPTIPEGQMIVVRRPD